MTEDFWPLNTTLYVRDIRGNDTLFLAYLLRTVDFQSHSGKSGVPGINRNDIHKLPISLPPPSEQRPIAKALSDVDGLLEAMDALIAKKRAIMQAAMKQLLTGRTRLPGFDGEWETKRIGDTCTCLPTASNPRADLVEHGDVEYIHYGDIHAYARPVLDCTRSDLPRIQQSRIANAAKLKDGDLVMVDASEDLEGVGKSMEIQGTNGRTVVAGLHTILCRSVPGNWAMGFKAYLQFIPELKSCLTRVATGISVYAISRSQLADIELLVPPILEQEAIVSVLSDMDAEIAALEQRRNKSYEIRQGMLQQLLTGQVRLAKTEQATDLDEVTGTVEGKHNRQFNEAVVISVLARNFGTEQYPVGRKRYTKLLYLLHRHNGGRTQGYLKKAAGPYNPRIRYGGSERIALDKGYIRRHKNKDYQGFVADSHVGEAEEYFDKWYGKEAIQWLEQFRYKRNDELELLTTVDMAAEELRVADKEVSVESVKNLILDHKEWKAKMGRRIFADANLARAIEYSRTLLAVSDERDTA